MNKNNPKDKVQRVPAKEPAEPTKKPTAPTIKDSKTPVVANNAEAKSIKDKVVPTTNAVPASNPNVPKERKKMTLPTETVPFILQEDRTTVHAVNEKLDGTIHKINQLNIQLNEKKLIEKELVDEEGKAKSLLTRITKRIVSLEKEKETVHEKVAEMQKIKKMKGDELAALKHNIDLKWPLKPGIDTRDKEANISRINSRVKQLEQEFSQSKMSLGEEKKRVQEISSLKSLTTPLQEYFVKQKDFLDFKVRGTEEQFKRIDSQIFANQEAKIKQEEIIEDLERRLEECREEIKEIKAKDKRLNTTVKALNIQLTGIRSKIDNQKAQWVQERDQKREQERLEKEKKRKEQEAARLKRDSERMQKELKKPFFDEEVKTCDKLISKLTAEKPKEGEKSPKTLLLGVEVLAMFEVLSMEVPTSSSQIDENVEAIKNRKQVYLAWRSLIPRPAEFQGEVKEKRKIKEKPVKENKESSQNNENEVVADEEAETDEEEVEEKDSQDIENTQNNENAGDSQKEENIEEQTTSQNNENIEETVVTDESHSNNNESETVTSAPAVQEESNENSEIIPMEVNEVTVEGEEEKMVFQEGEDLSQEEKRLRDTVSEGKVEEKSEEKVEEQSEEKVEEKSEEKIEEKMEEKAEEKVEENSEEKEEKLEEKVEEKEQEKSEEIKPAEENSVTETNAIGTATNEVTEPQESGEKTEEAEKANEKEVEAPQATDTINVTATGVTVQRGKEEENYEAATLD